MAGAPKGNQNAAKSKRLSAHLQKRIEERKLEPQLMDALLEKALTGDIPALKEVFDRLEGKPKQPLDVEANVTTKSADELTDEELASIAARRSK